MNLKPLSDNIIIKPIEMENSMKSGIILTASAKEKQQIAEVVAVGPGKVENGKTLPVPVKAGDKVITGQYAGTEVKIGDEKFTIVSCRDVLAIVEDE